MSCQETFSLRTFRPNKLLVIGVGNTILRDDGIGLKLVSETKKKYSSDQNIDFKIASIGGLVLAEQCLGYQQVIIVDAVATENGVPGTVTKFSIEEFPINIHSTNIHDCTLATAFHLFKREIPARYIPSDIIIIGIEVAEIAEFGIGFSAPIKKAIPVALKKIQNEIKNKLALLANSPSVSLN
jgi:hydrogenase maturation protease